MNLGCGDGTLNARLASRERKMHFSLLTPDLANLTCTRNVAGSDRSEVEDTMTHLDKRRRAVEEILEISRLTLRPNECRNKNKAKEVECKSIQRPLFPV